jgi:hypothetical protein
VLPVAIPIEEATEPAVVMFTTNAPSQIAGHTRYPSSRNATRAIPVGGHTAVALACTKASISPSFPAMT